ncbi:MAG: amidase [Anaerolineales bacterium]|nr:MAG: amidase [Anaerolineales bacterium]
MSASTKSQPLLVRLAAALRADDRAIFQYLDWLQERFTAREPAILAFLPEAQRFARLNAEAQQLLIDYPDPAKRPALFGLPFGVKDIFRVAGFETHAGSQLPATTLAGDEAISVTRLRQAGALIQGKTVTTEFAYFAPGPTTNPHHPGHTPGGSSSGSAAAVAAGLTALALGTQTIGSINRPAAFCGVVGYKPTFGRIPTGGVIPLSPSLDHVGYFTPDAASAAWVAPVLVDYWSAAQATPVPIRLAIPTGPYLDSAGPEALRQLEADSRRLLDAGHSVIEIPALPDFEAIVQRHNLILAAEAARVHQSWYADNREKYHPKTADLIQRGSAISSEALQAALPGRAVLRMALEVLMDEHAVDAWITPAAPGPAPQGLDSTGDPVMNLPWTQCGMPTMTLPSGRASTGLPLGLQIIARAGWDEQLLAWASEFESLFQYESLHGLGEFLEANP